jgi:branched-chain amino acid transport system substrate-binding protein
MRFLGRRGVVAALAATALLVLVSTQSAAAPAAKCNASNPVVLGTIYSVTGPAAGIGRLAQQGASMAIRDVNDAGGILGRCVKQSLKDDTGSPTAAAQVARQLIDQEHVPVIIGPFLSSPTSVVLPLATQAKVVMMNQSAFADSGDARKWPYTFRVEANNDQIAQIMVPFLKARGYKRIGLFAPNNAFGIAWVPSITKLAEDAGLTIVKSVLVPSGTPDVTPQMSELKGASPQAMAWAVNADPDQIAAIKARNSLGLTVPVIATSAMVNTATTNNFSKDQLKNIFAYQYKTLLYKAGQNRPTDPLVKAFISKFSRWIHAHNLKVAISQAAGSYDAVTLYAKAANATKSLDAEALKRYFETHKLRGVRGDYVWTTTRHDGPIIADFGYGIPGSLNSFGLIQAAPAK